MESKRLHVLILRMVIPPLMMGILKMGDIDCYYWVGDHPLLHGNHGSLDPSTFNKYFLEVEDQLVRIRQSPKVQDRLPMLNFGGCKWEVSW